MNKHALVLVTISLVCIAVSLFAVSTLMTQAKIHSGGQIKAIGIQVYSDSGLTTLLTEIDWGMLEPGQVADRTIYLKNTGNAPITVSMTVDEWNPTFAADYISMSWDAEGLVIAKDGFNSAILSINISSSIVGITNFNMTTTIVGTNN